MHKQKHIRKDIMRDIAIRATRSYLCSQGIDPKSCTSDNALAALEDLRYINPGTIAANFVTFASNSQINKFHQDWTRYTRGD